MNDDVKPCPFCGHLPEVWQRPDGGWVVNCENGNCDCVAGTAYHNEFRGHAVAAWNKRANPKEEEICRL